MINPRTFVIKSVKNTAVYLGYSNLVKSPYDNEYWMPSYSEYNNLSNPFANYQFIAPDGTVVERSLAQLCLFEESAFNHHMNNIRNIITECIDNGLVTTTAPTIYFWNSRFNESRFANPGSFFNYPHTTDVFFPEATLPRGLPYAKLDNFQPLYPTQKLFNRNELSDSAFMSLFSRIRDSLNGVARASNIHPSLIPLFFEVNSVPERFSVDRQNMDAFVRSRIASGPGFNRYVGRHGAFSPDRPYIFYDTIGSIRAAWANVWEGDERNLADKANDYSAIFSLGLDSISVAFRPAFVLNVPNPSNRNSNIDFNISGSLENQVIMSSLESRNYSRRIYQGVYSVGSVIVSFMQYMNLLSAIKDHLPQVFLHAGMSFYRTVIGLAFRHLRTDSDMVSVNERRLMEDFDRYWMEEVNYRSTAPSSGSGVNVFGATDITPGNIGTLVLNAGRTAAESGSLIGGILIGVGALIRRLDSPVGQDIIRRYTEREVIRSNGEVNLNTNVYRGYRVKDVITCVPVMRYSSV